MLKRRFLSPREGGGDVVADGIPRLQIADAHQLDQAIAGRERGYDRRRQVVEQALAMGDSDVGVIRYLLKLPELQTGVTSEALEVGWLSRYERPQPTLYDYDRLLGNGFDGGDPGKTHIATGLAIEAWRQRNRVRFTTAAELVNELVEARERNEVSRAVGRWMRYELIVLDELCYVAIGDRGRIIVPGGSGTGRKSGRDRHHELTVLRMDDDDSERAVVQGDRLTDQAQIIETGTESYRFGRTMAKNKGAKA